MMDEVLHNYAEANGLLFENVLVGFVKEHMLKALYEEGFTNFLWLKNPSAISVSGYKQRVWRQLSFVYKEDERVLKNDGFVPGCAFDEAFLPNLYKKVFMEIPEFRMQEPTFETNGMLLHIYYKEMYVPIFVEVEKLKEESITAQTNRLTLPILGNTFALLVYPMEQEAATHVAKVCKELELIGEMEHYLQLYKIFSLYSVDGVRLQNAIRQELERVKLDYERDDFNAVLGFRDYGYMKKKWKVLLRRQKIDAPQWEEVIDLLDKVLSPLWQASRNDLVFFGDWMPEIGRYLD